MTVVRELVAKLSIDDTQFRRDVERAAQEGARSLQRAFSGTIRPDVDTSRFGQVQKDAQAAARGVEQALGRGTTKVAVNDSELAAVAPKAQAAARAARSALEQPIRPVVDTAPATNALHGLAAVISTIGIGAALKQTIQTGLEGAGSLETARLQFKTLLGSATEANQRVQELFKFAAETPFETQELIQASRMLQTFGGDALASEASLRRVADAAAAVAAPVEEVGFWMGRAVSAIQGGQPFGEAAQRLQELGLLTPQVRQEMENLQKTGASSSQVIDVLNESFDRFAGSSKDLASTLPGVISTFKDNITLGLAAAFDGEPLERFKTGILGIGETLSGLIGDIAPELSSLAVILSDTLGDGLKALAPAIDAVMGLIVELADVAGGVLTESLEGISPIITIAAEGLTLILQAVKPLTPVLAAAADAWLAYKAASAIGSVTELAGAGLLGIANKAGLAQAPIEGIAGGLGKLGSILPQVGIAIGVGAAAWALFGSEEKKVIDVNDGLIGSLGDIGDMLTALQLEQIAKELSDTDNAGKDAGKRFLELAQSGKLTGDTLVAAMKGGKQSAKDLADQLIATSEIDLTGAFSEGLSGFTPEIAKVIRDLQPEILQFAVTSGQGFGDDFIKASELPPKLQAEFLKMTGIAKDSEFFDTLQFDVKGPDAKTLGAISDLIIDGQKLKASADEASAASKTLSSNLADVEESATGATDEMKRFSDLVKEQFSQLDATEKLQELQRAFADFKITDGDTVIQNFTGSLGGLDEVSRNATDGLNDLIAKSQGMIQASIDSGQPLTDVIGKYNFLRQSIIDTAASHGIARDKVEEYLASVGFVPDEVTTLLIADSKDGKIIVKEWAQILAFVPPETRTKILANLDPAQRKAVEDQIQSLTGPKNLPVTPKLTSSRLSANSEGGSSFSWLFSFMADGGIVPYRPGGWPSIIGEAGPEVVIPLSDAARARELVAQSGLLNLISGPSTKTSTVAGGQVTSGATTSVGGTTINFTIQSTDPLLAAREIEQVLQSVLARSGLPVGL